MAQDDYKMKSTETVTNNNTLTAVEWLAEELKSKGHALITTEGIFINVANELLEQAKKMEKEQIMDAYEQGAIDGRFEMFSDNTVHNALEYYIKTFQDDTIR